MKELKEQFGKYLRYEMEMAIGDYSSAVTATQVYRFENGFGIAILFLKDYHKDIDKWLMRFSFKLLNPDGTVLEKINSKDLENKIHDWYYSTYYFQDDNEKLIKAVISLINEIRAYFSEAELK